MTAFNWVAVKDPRTGTNRMTTWMGETRQIVVTGLPPGFAENCPCHVVLPPGAAVHAYPHDGVDGVVFTMFTSDADRLLASSMLEANECAKPDGKERG